MKRIRIIGLALVAMFAMSAVASATASAALPELVNSSGVELVKKNFTIKSGAGKLESTLGTVECSSDTGSGKVTGLKTDEATVTFKGCKLAGTSTTCQSGAEAGVIVTNALKSEVVYIKSTEPKEVGVKITPVGTLLAKFSCGTLTFEVSGETTGKITPINKFVKTTEHYTLEFNKASGLILNGTVPSKLTTTEELTFEEESKINA
jgi:hypothetical protein